MELGGCRYNPSTLRPLSKGRSHSSFTERIFVPDLYGALLIFIIIFQVQEILMCLQ